MPGLPIAQLAIYAPLTLPVLYLLYTHGRHGFLAWAYLLAFCILRMTGGALAVSDPTNAGAQIISSIGLSPMLLSLEGVLHEARVYATPYLNRKLEYTFMGFFHVLVATGVAMVGVGAGGLVSNKPKDRDSDLSDVKVGMALLEASWAILVLWALWTVWTGSSGHANKESAPASAAAGGSSSIKEGRILLTATLLALPLLEISVIYTFVAEYTQRADLNPSTGTLAVRVVLGFLPELIAALVLVLAGIRTRGVNSRRVGEVQQGQHGHRARRGSSTKKKKGGRRSHSRSRSQSVRRDAWV
ncbi:hypothetical protein HK57_00461 [Aspergillus ustus]|uniref:DUF7702 domain-containing protein n=1 Tax=Aspergillus ustus TaxID=40382 RepID=A0A0C1BW20_ASPUT|nr:hypothetical protein HK57_00461 [Aspergillus ustus]